MSFGIKVKCRFPAGCNEHGADMTLDELSTREWQALDSAHHMAPFCDYGELRQHGARIITHAEGHYIHDSEGNRILDGMAGLWCVNVGYGRTELVEAASRQMTTLPYYNLSLIHI